METVKKSARLQTVCQLKQMAEREEAKKLALTQQEFHKAVNQQEELKSYLQEYFKTIQNSQSSVNNASQLALYQAFVTRLQLAIERQGEAIKQREIVLKKQTKNWQEANANLKTMKELVTKAQIEESLAEDKKQQREMDDRTFKGNLGFFDEP